MAKKELTKKEDNELAEVDLFPLEDNLEACDPVFPTVSIVHAAQMFKMPDGTMVGAFKGRLIDMNRDFAYWPEKKEGEEGTKPPLCFSNDGVLPSQGSDKQQSDNCNTCEKLEDWETGCKKRKRLHIIPENSESGMPMRLIAPVSSLKAIDKYISGLNLSAMRFQLVTTVFSLIKKTKGEETYSVLELASDGQGEVKDRETQIEIKASRDKWLSVMREG